MPKAKSSKKRPSVKKKTAAKPKRSAKKPAAKVKKTKKVKVAYKKPRLGSDEDLAALLPWRQPLPGEKFIGEVDDYFGHIEVITTTLKTALRVGDKIHVRGHTTDITQNVGSIQIEHKGVEKASAGDGIGLKVDDKCRRGDHIYLIL